MSFLAKGKKIDLLDVCEELGEEVPPNSKIPDLKNVILKSKNYVEEEVRIILDRLIEERRENEAKRLQTETETLERQAEAEKQKIEAALERERLRAEAEKQQIEAALERERLEVQRLQLQATATASPKGTEVQHKIPLAQITPKFDEKKDEMSLFLVNFERCAEMARVPKAEWVVYLLHVMPPEIANMLARESVDNANSFDYVKELILKKYKLSAEKLKTLFYRHQKDQEQTWRSFAHELGCYFKEWISELKISTFEDLVDLLIAERVKIRAPDDIKEHFFGEWLELNKPEAIAEKFDAYESLKESLKRNKQTKQTGSRPNHNENRTKIFDNRRKFGDNRGRGEQIQTGFTENRTRYGNRRHGGDSTDQRSSRTTQEDPDGRGIAPSQNRTGQKNCFECNSPDHLRNACPEVRKKNQENSKSQERFPNVHTLHEDREEQVGPRAYMDVDLQKFTREINIGNQVITALLDTGSARNILRFDVFRRMEPRPHLFNETIVLTGLGQGHVKTLGSFRHVVEVNGHICRLDFQVVPSAVLKFEAIIGSAFLAHAPCPFHEENIQAPPESPEWIFQISENTVQDELELNHIEDKDLGQCVANLISSYQPRKTKTVDVSMKIVLKDETPTYQRARRLSFPERQEVNKQIDDWLKEGIVRPSSSDYASPIVLVKKKDQTTRVCVDYRQLNRKLIKDRFPLPLIEDVLDQLQDAKVFTTLDLKNGFFHVPVEESSRKYTSFIVPDGQFEFLKVPFGLSTSPSVFQRYVNCIFRDLIRKGVVILYMDDLVIPSKDEFEGVEKLKMVLEVASEYGLEIKTKKCQFLKRSVEFLGHIVENGTVRPSTEKTIAVQRFPCPKNAKQVQSFLGLTGYFRKFVQGYSNIAKPLSDLLRKDQPFIFGDEQKEAYQRLKNLLITSPILHIFKPGRKTELHTDASKDGFGAILFQESDDGQLHPVYYMSKKTNPAEEKYSSYELEVLAVVEALKKLRVYLAGNKFKIVTDCSAFQKTMDKKDIITRIARWALLLEEFDYEIVHRPAQRMQHVDALSRNPVMIIDEETITARIRCAQEKDEGVITLKSLLKEGEEQEFFVKNRILYKYENGRELIVIPEGMEKEIIKTAHEKGHFAVAKTKDIIKREFYIPKLNSKVEDVIAHCIPCILANKKAGKKEGMLHPIPKEDTPLHTYHVDFIGPLPSTNKNYQHILTVIDAFTKFVWLYPTKSVSAEDALDKIKLQQQTFGNPVRIITDRGTAFTSNSFKEYCEKEGIQHLQIATGVPRGNGQVERIHRTLIPTLTKLTIEDATKWFKYVPDAQKTLNDITCRSTKFTPFELLTGVKMRSSENLALKEILVEEMFNEYNDRRNQLRQEAIENITKIQEENRKQHNKKCKAATKYKKGDIVAIQRTQFGSGLKLRPKFFGPYEVTKVKGNERYEVSKIGNHAGPNQTTSAADLMKPFG